MKGASTYVPRWQKYRNAVKDASFKQASGNGNILLWGLGGNKLVGNIGKQSNPLNWYNASKFWRNAINPSDLVQNEDGVWGIYLPSGQFLSQDELIALEQEGISTPAPAPAPEPVTSLSSYSSPASEPVYVAPTYNEPEQVYVAPAPVYVEPAPVPPPTPAYVPEPEPVYVSPSYYAPESVYVEPEPTYENPTEEGYLLPSGQFISMEEAASQDLSEGTLAYLSQYYVPGNALPSEPALPTYPVPETEPALPTYIEPAYVAPMYPQIDLQLDSSVTDALAGISGYESDIAALQPEPEVTVSDPQFTAPLYVAPEYSEPVYVAPEPFIDPALSVDTSAASESSSGYDLVVNEETGEEGVYLESGQFISQAELDALNQEQIVLPADIITNIPPEPDPVVLGPVPEPEPATQYIGMEELAMLDQEGITIPSDSNVVLIPVNEIENPDLFDQMVQIAEANPDVPIEDIVSDIVSPYDGQITDIFDPHTTSDTTDTSDSGYDPGTSTGEETWTEGEQTAGGTTVFDDVVVTDEQATDLLTDTQILDMMEEYPDASMEDIKESLENGYLVPINYSNPAKPATPAPGGGFGTTKAKQAAAKLNTDEEEMYVSGSIAAVGFILLNLL